MSDLVRDRWGLGREYEHYVGRWSRHVAGRFIPSLDVPAGSVWADIGVGTGALTEAILAHHAPSAVYGADRSPGFVADARSRIGDPRVRLEEADATSLPWEDDTVDAAVSGLVLNFVPDHAAMAREMARVTKPGGTVALYVWDYAGVMEMMTHFWDVAAMVSEEGERLAEATRFPICQPDALRALFDGAGMASVQTWPVDIETVFRDFEDYWSPFLGKQGPAPTFLATLEPSERERVRSLLQERLDPGDGSPIALKARAWAVRGRVPGG